MKSFRKLPPNGKGISRPLSRTRFRGWLATWLQERRRGRQNILPPPVPNAPVIVDGGFEWGASSPTFADVWIYWNFVHGTFPAATIEIWVTEDYAVLYLLATVTSFDDFYVFINATEGEKFYEFKIRYRNGATIGPFSNSFEVNVQL